MGSKSPWELLVSQLSPEQLQTLTNPNHPLHADMFQPFFDVRGNVTGRTYRLAALYQSNVWRVCNGLIGGYDARYCIMFALPFPTYSFIIPWPLAMGGRFFREELVGWDVGSSAGLLLMQKLLLETSEAKFLAIANHLV